ncbi:hypothetical protein RN001_001777 [Aquatica leii]|uniref:superoxide dismutase n=1 Tax=Aquatica leii TaxID=1421715 RepID=A0AAN7PLK5_9COLE|nr:hypothetical protein RN001_001777 [Aquatica leii]
MFTKIEFAVQMTCESCVKAVKESLFNVPGISNVDINLENNSVVVDTTLTTDQVLKHLQSSGKKAVVKGIEGILAGVAVLDISKEIQGVVRFAQISSNTCIVDGTVDGLKPGKYGLYIHESGDISQGCNSVGDCFNPKNYDCSSSSNRAYSDLGIITAEANGRSSFRFQDNVINLSDVIGRSLVVTEHSKGPDCIGNRVTCGIIARSSSLFQNPKTICACDGISIWDERNQPKSSL